MTIRTPIRPLDGPRPIESIQVGDLVLSQDATTGALDFQPVVFLHHSPPGKTLRVSLTSGDSVVCSVYHRFWRANLGWAMARELMPGDVLRTLGGLARVEKVEPELGLVAATFLTDYPAVEAALARRQLADPRFAERFELYACGVELANGFGELTDPVEQRRRFELEMAEKERVYGERYPLDEDFLVALTAMPAASGVALGLDRLVMLLTGAPHIDLVQWTPVDTGERFS